MCATFASELLRPRVLRGVSVLLACAKPADGEHPTGVALAAEVKAACAELGADVWSCELAVDGSPVGEQDDTDEAVERTLAQASSVELLVVDAAALFASALCLAGGGRMALRSCLETTWKVTRAVAERAFLAHERAGRIVLLAPAGDAGEYADAARAGLENLARTLSVEWARYRVTVVALAPSSADDAGEVAAVTAYLASPAGAYFSGCVLQLGAIRPARKSP